MRLLWIAVGLAAANPAHGQSLRDAVEAAWARQPAFRSQTARLEELDARRLAANALTPEPPALGLENWSDRIFQNDGFRKYSGELALPLWLPGQRARLNSSVTAEQAQLGEAIRAAKLKIAGEVREAYWQARIGENERQIAQRKAEEASVLARDTERRVRAGTLARIDLNQARGAEQLARAAGAEAQARAYRAQGALTVLTGQSMLPSDEESAASGELDVAAHPQLAAIERAASSARERLLTAQSVSRDAPELGVGMFRERPESPARFENVLTIRVRIPFATEARNRPRIAAANAELIELQAALEREQARVLAELDATRRELEAARSALGFAETRFRLAQDSQALADRAFKLGEFDLPSRLRAENDRFDAELAFTRARAEVGRAVSRLNQAYGVLP
jgi:cobalt-zinc-cadmium efflux system outer membrane protein